MLTGEVVVTLAKGREFVCDVESGEDGDAEGIDRASVFAYGAHLLIYGGGKLSDIDGINTTQVINLVINFDVGGRGLNRRFSC